MPRISSFYGIDIYIYYRDHPPPHFHAQYGGAKAEIEIDSLTIIAGNLPNRAEGLVAEWAEEHREELQTNWERAREGCVPIIV
jgi:hypothetical protein